MPQRELFPLNLPNVIEHNTSLLVNYYTKKQHTFYRNIINANFTLEQNRDTGYTIQTQNNVAHIYEEIGKYLITIPMDRLKWLWKQYIQSQNRPHGLIPLTQLFETKIVWLYQRYIYIYIKYQIMTHLNIHTILYQKYYLITLQYPST